MCESEEQIVSLKNKLIYMFPSSHCLYALLSLQGQGCERRSHLVRYRINHVNTTKLNPNIFLLPVSQGLKVPKSHT